MSIECDINAAMAVFGITPPDFISFDGKLRRFGRNKSGWCVFFDGHIKAGAFGDWKTGVSEKFIEARKDITPKDRRRIAQQMRKAVVQRERVLRATQARAAKDCVLIWNNAGGDC